MERKIEFVVYGRPQQRGSKTPWNPRRKDGSLALRADGRPIIATMDSNKKSKDWMQQVRSAAGEQISGDIITGPVRLGVIFWFKRPASHFCSGRNSRILKPSAPLFHTQTPDLSKLLRALEDGLTGVIWNDDRQVCRYTNDTGKYWTTGTEMAAITITELDLATKEIG